MNTKLTLSLDKNVISRAKIYARRKNKSLSQIIEDYLKTIPIDTGNDSIIQEIPLVTRSLAGILKGKEEFDFKNEVSDYITGKYK